MQQAVIDHIPEELHGYQQWVFWRLVGQKKPPFSAYTGKLAYVNDPNTWSSFQRAHTALEYYGGTGLGFVLTPSDPYVGIDLDDVREPTGRLIGWAAQLVNECASYTEISPSGTGVKLFVRGTFSQTIRMPMDGGKIEVYPAHQYFTITGQHLPGTPTCIGRADDLLQRIATYYAKQSQPRPTPLIPASFEQLTTQETLKLVKAQHALAALSLERVDNYTTWINIGMALTELGKQGLPLWDTWSRQSGKYRDKECARRWSSFRRSKGCTLGTLYYYADQDSPDWRERRTPQPLVLGDTAYCPNHPDTRLVPARNRNGWRCPRVLPGVFCFWWGGSGYQMPQAHRGGR